MGLKFLLDSLGIRINPADIELAWNQARELVPKIAEVFQNIERRLLVIEERQIVIMHALHIRTAGKELSDGTVEHPGSDCSSNAAD